MELLVLVANGGQVMTSDIERDVDMLERDLAIRLQLYQVSKDFCGDALYVSESLENIGKLYLKRGRVRDEHRAWKCFARSVDVLQRLYRSSVGTGSPPAAFALRNALCRIGELHQERGQHSDVDNALSYFQRAMAINQRWHTGPSLQQMTMIQLRRWFLLLKRSKFGDSDLARDYFEHYLVGLEQLYKIDPWAIGEPLALLEILIFWCIQRGDTGILDQIDEFYKHVVVFRNKFIDESRDFCTIQGDIITSLLCLGLAYQSRGLPGDINLALDCLHCALSIQPHQDNASVGTAWVQKNIASILELMGEIYQERGQEEDTKQALSCFQRSLEIRQRLA